MLQVVNFLHDEVAKDILTRTSKAKIREQREKPTFQIMYKSKKPFLLHMQKFLARKKGYNKSICNKQPENHRVQPCPLFGWALGPLSTSTLILLLTSEAIIYKKPQTRCQIYTPGLYNQSINLHQKEVPAKTTAASLHENKF